MNFLDFVRGCTFDDFLLTPQLGVLPRRDPDRVDLSARFTEQLTLKRPLVSANMDTVTRAAMAIVMAEEGGIGVIDRGFRAGDIEPQVDGGRRGEAPAARHHHRSAQHRTGAAGGRCDSTHGADRRRHADGRRRRQTAWSAC